ncbi:poly(A)-specific ribonuclease PARN, putative [Leishmania tarentolae]|uniref:Poly(A)-specific ribonuclease PARN, putative n=1 Tax=Leishmania tarentolae TaxID=5689 RepID=A0A640KHN3_LEITA|nr:poly(A)-specific ribonuclease PARN, putative [Leishmania tarentolae]
MQVRRDNFPAVFPHFQELLRTCDFYAIDEEMTGIGVPEVTETITFAPSETYHAKRLAASRYSIIQVGVCLFHRVPVSSSAGVAGAGTPALPRYTAYPFNFLLFPQFADDYTVEERAGDVVVSPSALAFLRRHGMDFQRWVYDGMAFCDASREAALRARLATEAAEAAAQPETTAERLFTDAENAWLKEARQTAQALVQRVEAAWAAAAAEARQQKAGRVPFLSSMAVEGGKEAVLPVQASRAAREQLELELARECPQLSVRSRRAGSSGYVVTLVVLSPEELSKHAWRRAQKERRQLLDAVGFRLVFKELVKSRKPCVGHNCFADWLFLMSAMDGALPEQLPQWKARARELFPCMWDTRYLASRRDLFPNGRFGSISLGSLYETYLGASPHCAIELPLGFEGYDPVALLGRGGGDAAHEAGYDALMTGTVLLNLLGEAGYTLETAPAELSQKLALFRSLYAVDLGSDTADEYMATEAGVLDLEHAATMKPHHIESFLATQDVAEVSLYSVTDGRTLGVLPGYAPSAEVLARRLNENCSRLLRATPYVPPHLCHGSSGASVRTTASAVSTFPMPAPEELLRGGGGAMRRTMQRLMRCRRW